MNEEFPTHEGLLKVGKLEVKGGEELQNPINRPRSAPPELRSRGELRQWADDIVKENLLSEKSRIGKDTFPQNGKVDILNMSNKQLALLLNDLHSVGASSVIMTDAAFEIVRRIDSDRFKDIP